MSMLLHQYGDGALVCLLDIAKAYASMPHECLTYGIRLIGTPARIYNMVASIYAHSTGVYGDVRFPLRRGIKRGFPLSSALFVLVYEAFHQILGTVFSSCTRSAASAAERVQWQVLVSRRIRCGRPHEVITCLLFLGEMCRKVTEVVEDRGLQRQSHVAPRDVVHACELWVFAMCPVLWGSTVSYGGVAHFPLS